MKDDEVADIKVEQKRLGAVLDVVSSDVDGNEESENVEDPTGNIDADDEVTKDGDESGDPEEKGQPRNDGSRSTQDDSIYDEKLRFFTRSNHRRNSTRSRSEMIDQSTESDEFEANGDKSGGATDSKSPKFVGSGMKEATETYRREKQQHGGELSIYDSKRRLSTRSNQRRISRTSPVDAAVELPQPLARLRRQDNYVYQTRPGAIRVGGDDLNTTVDFMSSEFRTRDVDGDEEDAPEPISSHLVVRNEGTAQVAVPFSEKVTDDDDDHYLTYWKRKTIVGGVITVFVIAVVIVGITGIVLSQTRGRDNEDESNTQHGGRESEQETSNSTSGDRGGLIGGSVDEPRTPTFSPTIAPVTRGNLTLDQYLTTDDSEDFSSFSALLTGGSDETQVGFDLLGQLDIMLSPGFRLTIFAPSETAISSSFGKTIDFKYIQPSWEPHFYTYIDNSYLVGEYFESDLLLPDETVVKTHWTGVNFTFSGGKVNGAPIVRPDRYIATDGVLHEVGAVPPVYFFEHDLIDVLKTRCPWWHQAWEDAGLLDLLGGPGPKTMLVPLEHVWNEWLAIFDVNNGTAMQQVLLYHFAHNSNIDALYEDELLRQPYLPCNATLYETGAIGREGVHKLRARRFFGEKGRIFMTINEEAWVSMEQYSRDGANYEGLANDTTVHTYSDNLANNGMFYFVDKVLTPPTEERAAELDERILDPTCCSEVECSVLCERANSC